MPRKTRETSLPKPPPAPLDWKKIAKSGTVWDFVKGEDGDFTGKPETYKGRLKTEARKVGVDFESTVVEKNGVTILKVLAFEMNGGGKGDKPAAAQHHEASIGGDHEGARETDSERDRLAA